ncbi:MFS transporter [Mameliella alba]|nr:MFS transporter [Antarctobacter heliothermus]MBY6142575.1 MFS transporter [Mameliella alba]MCA0953700.1 MFS transporter [Mameliella alba]
MTRLPRSALLTLSSAYFILGVSSLAVIGLAAPISTSLDVPVAAVAQLVTLFALTYAVAAPVLQMLVGDRDRRSLLVIGLALIAFGSIVGGLTASYAVLAVSRVTMALGGALVGPMASAAGAALVTDGQRGTALGIVFGGMTIATVLGVPMATWLGTFLSWNMVLIVIGALAASVAVAVRLTLPAGSYGNRPDMRTLANLVLDRTKGPAIAVTFLQMAAQFVTYAVIGVYLTNTQNIQPQYLPAALMIFGAGGILGNVLATRLISVLGHDKLILLSLAGLIGSFGAFLLLSGGGLLSLAILSVWAAFGTLMMAPQQARLVSLAPAASNTILALNASALYLGMAAGAALGGTILTLFSSQSLPVFSALLSAAALASFLFSGRGAADFAPATDANIKS